MEEKMLNSYLESIEELVFEEEKIITYKVLSNRLGVHVNTAKQLLYAFLQEQKHKNKCLVHATYLLAGVLKDTSRVITIVSEKNKAKEAAKFFKVTSDHVYSIQKNADINDIAILCEFNKDSYKLQEQCVIKCSRSVIKIKNKENNGIKEIEKRGGDKIQVKSDALKDHKAENQTNKANQKTVTKSPKNHSSACNVSKDEKNSNKDSKSMKGIASMFANAAQKSVDKVKSNSKNNELNIVKNKLESEKTEENKSAFNSSTTHTSSSIKKSASKSREKKKSEGIKRKRIQVISDSEESSDDSDKTEETHFEEDEPPEKVIKFFEGDADDNEKDNEEKVKNKRKKRKLVDVTIMNEDGYLETRKEVAFVSDSDDERTKTSPQKLGKQSSMSIENKKENKEVFSSSGPKKQSSLLNFFKKN